MSLVSRKALIENGQNMEEVYFIDDTLAAAATAYTLKSSQQTVCVLSGAVGDTVITLPTVGEAAGLIYSITLITDGGQDVTVNDNGDDSRVAFTLVTMDTVLDYILLYCDGQTWWTLASEVA